MATTNARATMTTTTFRLEYTVKRSIRASAERVWALLTDADGFAAWNSTVTRLAGPIAVGQKLAIEVPAAPGRVFAPRVTELTRERMTWSDGFAPMFRGVRTFTVTPAADGVEFAMHEAFSGLMLPLIRGSLPDFAPIFETYANDLARAAEARG